MSNAKNSMTSDGAKTFAMNEGKHIIELMNKLIETNKETQSNEYNALVSELSSHFNNISGLFTALETFHDQESIDMMNTLKQLKENLDNIKNQDNNEIDNEDSDTDNFIDSEENPINMEESSEIDLNPPAAPVNSKYTYFVSFLIIVGLSYMWFYVLQ